MMDTSWSDLNCGMADVVVDVIAADSVPELGSLAINAVSAVFNSVAVS